MGRDTDFNYYPPLGKTEGVVYIPPKESRGWTLCEQPDFFRYTVSDQIDALVRETLDIGDTDAVMRMFPVDMTSGNVTSYDKGTAIFHPSILELDPEALYGPFCERFGFTSDSPLEYFWTAALMCAYDAKVGDPVSVIPRQLEIRQFDLDRPGTLERNVKIGFYMPILYRNGDTCQTVSISSVQQSDIGPYRARREWKVDHLSDLSTPQFTDRRLVQGPHPVIDGGIQQTVTGYRVSCNRPPTRPFTEVMYARQRAFHGTDSRAATVIERGCGSFHDLENLQSMPNGGYWLVQVLPPDVEAMERFITVIRESKRWEEVPEVDLPC